jgi:hypothetical protein
MMSSQGIEAIPGNEIADREAGHERAVGAVDEATEIEELARVHFRPGDNLVVKISIPAKRVVLLQLFELTCPPYFDLICLAPSFRHGGTAMPPEGLIPATPDHRGRRGFVLGQDPGRVDLLALVSDQSLIMPFTDPTEPRYHHVDQRELQQLQQLIVSEPSSMRVLHLPIRIA